MPKQKVRQSVETATADQAVEPAPALCDDMKDDFMAFVRLALMLSMQNWTVQGHCSLVWRKKLYDIDDRVTGQATTIAGLTESVEFNSANINPQQRSIDIVKKSLVEANRDLQSATMSIAKLEAKLVASERHSRSFNVRLLGVPETDGENCVATVVDLLDRKVQLSGSAPVIENAHRIGKAQQGKPRHIIARFYSRVTRSTVMRTTRTNLRDSPLRFVDDLTKDDLLEKQRVRPLMDELFKTNRRPSFRNGKLYAEGRPVSEGEINTFLKGHQRSTLLPFRTFSNNDAYT